MDENTSRKVTVYLINHNYARYVRQSIESVLHQTMKDFELIIIDDGSTDHSRSIIEEFENHEQVTVIFQHNRGLNVSNNIALRASQGKYIMRLDADDFLDPHALRVMCDILDGDNELCFVFPDYYRIDDNGYLIDIVRHQELDEITLSDKPVHGACTMFRSKYLKEIGGYDEEFRCQDGFELWIRALHQERMRNINLPLFYYRQHDRSLTRNENGLLETRRKILEKVVRSQGREIRGLAIIPVRGAVGGTHSTTLRPLAGRPLINWTIDAALQASHVSDVVVTTPDPDVISHVEKTYGDQVFCVKRDPKLARLNTLLSETLVHAVSSYSVEHGTPEAVVLLMIESPFRNAAHIDSALNTMKIFETDVVVGVRGDTNVFYRHDGGGLVPIHRGCLLRLEAELLYREGGQLRVFSSDAVERADDLDVARVGHVMLDQQAAFVIETEWDWQIAEFEAMRGSPQDGRKAL